MSHDNDMLFMNNARGEQMEEYYPYPCKKCGSCCRYTRLIPDLVKYDRGDGSCKYLEVDNTCSIYEHRPDVCNGRYVYEKHYSGMAVSDYHKMIAKYCQEIREGKLIERLSENVQSD